MSSDVYRDGRRKGYSYGAAGEARELGLESNPCRSEHGKCSLQDVDTFNELERLVTP